MTATLFGETGSASFSDDEVYRWMLGRRWADRGRVATFVMCNPSTADAERNDPTITRCVRFARAWGMAGINVLNLYAYRATKPADLWAAARAGVDIVGPDNDRHLADFARLAVRAQCPLVAAWGAHPKPDRIAAVRALTFDAWTCLGTTAAGQPRHPLMVRNDVEVVPWPPTR